MFLTYFKYDRLDKDSESALSPGTGTIRLLDYTDLYLKLMLLVGETLCMGRLERHRRFAANKLSPEDMTLCLMCCFYMSELITIIISIMHFICIAHFMRPKDTLHVNIKATHYKFDNKKVVQGGGCIGESFRMQQHRT